MNKGLHNDTRGGKGKIRCAVFTRLVKLSFFAPDITKAILEGRHPPDLTAGRLINHARLPLDWKAQRTALGFT